MGEMTMHLNRRIFLRGLGGALVAAPFLSSVADRYAKAESLPTPSVPKRLVVMFTHYGCVTTRFFPTKSHGTLTAADLESTTLAPLSPYVRKLLIPRGIRAMNEWGAKLVRGQGNDPHAQAVGTYFTLQPLSPNSNDPFSFGQSAKAAPPMPVGPSLDHIMAQQLSPSGTPLVVQVGNQRDSAQSCISYSAAKKLFAGLTSPKQLYAQLTGLFKADEPLSPDSYRAARGKSILDLVQHDLAALSRLDMSRSDKLKLDAWKELLHQTQPVLTSAQCSAHSGEIVGATDANIAALKSTASTDLLTTQLNDSLDGADLYSAVTVLSAACNFNPVIVLKYPSNWVFKGLGLSQESHSLSHRLPDASMVGNCVDGALDKLHTIDKYYAKKFAKLVQMLDDIQEGDQTLLDHSAAVWFQEMSDGAAHNLNNLPIIQAGGLSGYFKTGWTINVEDGSASLPRGNSEAACTPETSTKIDGTTQSTATPATIANAPINKYYCNLMNALGVKAGADGFPLKDGTAEVTHFGMYDKTEDFVGGGTNPPMIRDPGAFEALKANA
jgi:hypothetical protein